MSPSKDPADSASGTSTPKIAIKGFSLSSKPSTPKPGSKPLPSTLGKRPRSTFAAHEDSDSENEGKGRHEAVVAFGEGGAVRHEERAKAEPLVIKRVGNRDWKAEARARRGGGEGERKGKNLLPPEVQAMREAQAREREAGGGGKREGVDVVNGGDAEIQWGLSVRKKVAVEEDGENGGDTNAEDGNANVEKETNGSHQHEEVLRAQTADEEAIAALTGETNQRKGPDLIIRAEPLSEEEEYRRSVAAAPSPSTLEDYERVPVEEFGAALLRGMGWNGEERGKVRDVKRRQNLLGLGAKELKDAEELGAWVGRSDVKRLNGGGRGGGSGDRRPRVSEYKREKERRDERREERGGGSYRREKERERERDGGGYRERDRERDRDGYRERDRRR